VDKISIHLSINEWNIVLNALGQRPYLEVVDLIAEIKRQGETAVKLSTEVSVDQGLA
jgi:hypothetical protein